MERYLQLAFEWIGTTKILWGIDLPRLLSHATYRQPAQLSEYHTRSLTSAEQELVLGGMPLIFLRCVKDYLQMTTQLDNLKPGGGINNQFWPGDIFAFPILFASFLLWKVLHSTGYTHPACEFSGVVFGTNHEVGIWET